MPFCAVADRTLEREMLRSPSRALTTRPVLTRTLLTLGVGSWLLLALGYFSYLALESSRPCPGADAPSERPSGCGLGVEPERATLVVFLHPRCPCSRATLDRLDRLVALPGFAANVEIDITLPVDSTSEWADSSAVARARELPGAHVTLDAGGAVAQRFGAHTSGQVVLYDPRGRRVFSGGITQARGEVGDNSSFDALLAHLRGERGIPDKAPVFGCALVLPDPPVESQR